MKRRVLILNFQDNAPGTENRYLSSSIADAYLQPLEETDNFIILSREKSGVITDKEKYSNADLFTESVALKIGREAEADVVLMGSYTIYNKELRLSVRALDVIEGRSKVSKTTNTRISSSLFRTIDESAEEMATAMARDLPPMKQRVIYEKGIGGILSIRPNARFAVYDSSEKTGADSNIDHGAGFNLKYEQKLLSDSFSILLDAGYYRHNGFDKIQLYEGYTVSGGFSYTIPVSENFQIAPFLAGGIAGGRLTAFKNTDYLLGMLSTGVDSRYFLTRAFFLLAGINVEYWHEPATPFVFTNTVFGMGVKI